MELKQETIRDTNPQQNHDGFSGGRIELGSGEVGAIIEMWFGGGGFGGGLSH